MKKILLLLFLFCNLVGLAQANATYQKTWATYFGGQGTRIVNSAIDSNHNIIVAGVIIGGSVNALQDQAYYNQFATTTNPSYLYNSSRVSPSGTYSNQSIVAKFSPEGSLLESKYLPLEIVMMKINKFDEVFISGTSTQNNIGTSGCWMSSPLAELTNGPQNGVIAKLNVNFTIDWLTYLPTTSFGIFTLDNFDNIYASSFTNKNNSITTNDTFQPNFITEVDNDTGQNYANGYLLKLNNLGQLQWATYCGLTTPQAISFNHNELLVSFQRQQSTLTAYDSYYFTADTYQQTPSSQIISKFNATTGQRLYSTYLGNDNLSITNIVGQDQDWYLLGNVYGTAFSDGNLISPYAFQTTFNGNQDIYLGKFNATGAPIWGTYIGGPDYEETSLQSNLNVMDTSLYFSGFSYSSGVINNSNTYQSINQGNGDLFMMKFAETGIPIWGSYFGGNNTEEYGSVVPVTDDMFYWVGETYSQTSIATPMSYQANLSSNPSFNAFHLGNGFVAKFIPQNLELPNFSFDDLILYPNPAKGHFTIKANTELEGITFVTIYNALGQKIATHEIDLTTDQYITVDHFESGVYYIAIKNKIANKSIQKKLILR